MRYAYGPSGERKQVPAQNLNPGNDIGGAQPINPVLQDIRRQEVISDPAVRELYFGSY
jgi:hypothetical protein